MVGLGTVLQDGRLRKAVTVVIVATLAVGLAGWQVHDRIGLEQLRDWVGPLIAANLKAPLVFGGLYFSAYVAITALCIPLEVPFALVAGAIFGLAEGVLITSFASIVGATLAFLWARHLLRGHVEQHFAVHIETINAGMERDGAFYLVNLRLLPVLPFSLVNILMGLTRMRTRVFILVSQASMIFATVLFVNAGTQILHIRSYGDILSPPLVAGLAGLAALPWLGKGLMYMIRRARFEAVGRVVGEATS